MRHVRWLRGKGLRAADFPPETPLNRFFAWNEAARRRDRRYVIAVDLHRLLTAFGGGDPAREICVHHLAVRPVILARLGDGILVSREVAEAAAAGGGRIESGPRRRASRRLIASLVGAVGTSDRALHAAVFAAFEELAAEVDLNRLAAARPGVRSPPQGSRPRRILVIRLSAFGDFVQSLGPAEAIRRYHAGDRVSLLTTAPFAAFAGELGWFDEVLTDRRPRARDVQGWLRLRRELRAGRFDRVYDLQTSERSSAYRWLFGLRDSPEWSGIAWRCSHPHANLDRDRQHTLDKQAEQLLMAGISPTPLPSLPPLKAALPETLAGRHFVLLVPGSSPHRPAKRWPALHFGSLAQALDRAGYVPVVVGVAGERALANAIRSRCPQALDLVGRTDLARLGVLARGAKLTIANDTGVGHLAAAAGSPLVALFSAASDPARCAPRGRLVRILAVPDLSDLEPDDVLAEAMAILKRPLASNAGVAAADEHRRPGRLVG